MCGIGGRFDLEGSRDPDVKILKGMADGLTSRGPDGHTIHTAPGLGLIHTRLAIMDLKSGQQPFFDNDNNITAIANGEFYTHQELRSELEIAGAQFRSHCDAEVVAHLYGAQGIQGLLRLQGEFAFALVDAEKQRLILACDPFRTKPLRWMKRDGWLCFSSDARIFNSHSSNQTESELDLKNLHAFLAYGSTPGGGTLWKNVYSMQPGTILVFERGQAQPEIHRYPTSWSSTKTTAASNAEASANTPPLKSHPQNEISEQPPADLKTALLRSVRHRLQGDSLPGIWLSGGIDSAILCALAAELTQRRIEAFTLRVIGPGYDELPLARLTAEKFGVKLHEFDFEITKLEDLFPGFEALDTPLADTAIHTATALARETGAHVKSALSGEGADELFGGYPEYRADSWANRIPKPLINSMEWVGQHIPSADQRMGVGDTVRRFTGGTRDKHAPHAWRWRRCISETDLSILFKTEWEPREINGFEINGSDPGETDLLTYLPDVLLPKADRAGMAHGLEIRVPYLDEQVVNISRSKPFMLGKKPLRAIAKNLDIPAEVLAGRKRGFSAPVRGWLRKELAGKEVMEFLTGKAAHIPNLINKPVVEQWMNEHQSHKQDRHRELHALLSLEFWLRQNKIRF